MLFAIGGDGTLRGASALADEVARRELPISVVGIPKTSYLVRTCAANATDAELCLRLGQHAVHAAMAGRTRLLVGSWHGHFTHVPLGVATAQRRRIDPRGSLWQSVLESTGQHMCLRGQRPQDSSPP